MLHLIDFAIAKGLVEPIDRAYALNRLLEIMQMDAPEDGEFSPCAVPETATAYLDALCDDACARGIIGDSAERPRPVLREADGRADALAGRGARAV